MDFSQEDEDRENGQFYSNDNPYNGSDDEASADFNDSYMEGWNYEDD